MQPSSVLLNAPPEPQTVRDQLARILASRDFLVPQRVQGFLTYVVEETLAGRGDRLKAIAIATDVFGRGLDFDAMNDPVVRIEAGRLRRALERYYLLSGSVDPVIIDIPKGAYTPTFTQREGARVAEEPVVKDPPGQELPAAHPGIPRRRWLSALLFTAFAVSVLTAATWPRKLEEQRPKRRATAPEITLAVAPFSNLAGPATGLFAAGVFEELLAQLARFRELRIVRAEVVSPPSTNGGPLPTPQYRLEGSVRGGEQLRVTARLVDVESSRIVWSQIYERDLSNARIFDIEADIATKVAIAVAQPYGAIFGSQGTAADVPGSADAYQCVLRFYQYRKVLSPVEHASTRTCLERTTEQHPDYSTGWAMLAYLYLDEDRFGLNRREPAPAAGLRAREAAERAVLLDPANARGLQSLMTVLFFNQEPDAALRVGETALALNPNDTEVLAEFGSRLAQTGDWRRGAVMMEEAIARSAVRSGYYVGMVALAYYMQDDNSRAVEWIRRADLKQFSIYHFVAALIFARSGLERDAKVSVAAFMAMRPRFFDDFSRELSTRNFNARDRAILIKGAREAGFPVSFPSN